MEFFLCVHFVCFLLNKHTISEKVVCLISSQMSHPFFLCVYLTQESSFLCVLVMVCVSVKLALSPGRKSNNQGSWSAADAKPSFSKSSGTVAAITSMLWQSCSDFAQM